MASCIHDKIKRNTTTDGIMDTTNKYNVYTNMLDNDKLYNKYKRLYLDLAAGIFDNDLSKLTREDKSKLLKYNNKIRRKFTSCQYTYLDNKLIKIQIRNDFYKSKKIGIVQFKFEHFVDFEKFRFIDLNVNVEIDKTIRSGKNNKYKAIPDSEKVVKLFSKDLKNYKIYDVYKNLNLINIENIQSIALLNDNDIEKTKYVIKIIIDKYYKPKFFNCLKSLEYLNFELNQLIYFIYVQIFKKYNFSSCNSYNDMNIDDRMDDYCITLK